MVSILDEEKGISIPSSSGILLDSKHINLQHPILSTLSISTNSKPTQNQHHQPINMQFSILAAAAFAALTSAAALKRAPADLCPALDTPQCCQLDVDGVADLTCSAPESDLTTVADFEESCKSTGLTAMCCTLPVAGLALLCNAP
ncbi:hypothetical protein Q7P35_003140 [Cladosporium inversicolor]